MKSFRTNILLIAGFVGVFTFFQYYLTYLISAVGQNSFYDPAEHLSSLLRGLSSLVATYLAARWLAPEQEDHSPSIVAIFGLSSALFAVLVSVSYYVSREYFCGLDTDLSMIWGNIVLSFFFYHLVIAGMILAWFFFFRNQKNKLLLAQAESERKQLELKTLRQHLEPHFLFNNLSVLSSLVQQEHKEAGTFINHFAELYRYVVRQQAADVVTLQEELQFLHHYFYLITKRFNNVYQLRIGQIQHNEAMIPPASLQMLAENAVKHNMGSPGTPLQIHIEQEDEYLVVWNRKCLKPGVISNGTGLRNLQKRYSLLTDKKMIIWEDDCIFKVKIPLLTLLAP